MNCYFRAAYAMALRKSEGIDTANAHGRVGTWLCVVIQFIVNLQKQQGGVIDVKGTKTLMPTDEHDISLESNEFRL